MVVYGRFALDGFVGSELNAYSSKLLSLSLSGSAAALLIRWVGKLQLVKNACCQFANEVTTA